MVFSIIIPLIDLGTLALRWGLAADLIGSFTPKLAVMDKLSYAFAAVDGAQDEHNLLAHNKSLAIDKMAAFKKRRDEALAKLYNAQAQVERDAADPLARQSVENAQTELTSIESESKQGVMQLPKEKGTKTVINSNELFAMLNRLNGVKAKAASLTMVIESQTTPNSNIRVLDPAEIPSDWLPNGKSCPCLYRLELSVKAEVEPLFLMRFGGNPIPALNAPVPLTVTNSAIWENLGRDPLTGKYYLNE